MMAVNAAITLARPLLIKGEPGTGKTQLAQEIARSLGCPLYEWHIKSTSKAQQGLYEYDAVSRLRDSQLGDARVHDIRNYIVKGRLWEAFEAEVRPVLLIDEIDKADIDLPNDLLNIFEEGEYVIPELARLETDTIEIRAYDSEEIFPITHGHVQCHQFPFVVLTSNGEREFPPPFLRRCLRLEMPEPGKDLLAEIVEAHLGPETAKSEAHLIEEFFNRRTTTSLATDQLLNAIYLVTRGHVQQDERDRLAELLFRELTTLRSS
jgi:MoxR-like ATPase